MEGEQKKKTEILVGLFLLIGLLLLGGLILQFSRIRDAFLPTYQVRVRFEDASGLSKGAPVTVGGTKVGIVETKPTLTGPFSGVEAILELREEVEIPIGSTFKIKGDGLMGDKLVEIRVPEKSMGGMHPRNTDAIIDGSGIGGIGALEAAAEEIGEQTREVLVEIETAVEKLTAAIESFDTGFLGQENADHFKNTMASLDNAIAKVDQGILADDNLASVKEALTDLRATAGNFKSASMNVDEASKILTPTIEKAGPAIDKVADAGTAAEASLAEIGEAAMSLQSVLKRAEEGDGVMAALLQDEGLKGDMRNFIANLREHGVLGYKDDNRIAPDGTTEAQSDAGRSTSRPASERGRFPWSRNR